MNKTGCFLFYYCSMYITKMPDECIKSVENYSTDISLTSKNLNCGKSFVTLNSTGCLIDLEALC